MRRLLATRVGEMGGCPTFAKEYVGRKRWAAAQTIVSLHLITTSRVRTARKNNLFSRISTIWHYADAHERGSLTSKRTPWMPTYLDRFARFGRQSPKLEALGSPRVSLSTHQRTLCQRILDDPTVAPASSNVESIAQSTLPSTVFNADPSRIVRVEIVGNQRLHIATPCRGFCLLHVIITPPGPSPR